MENWEISIFFGPVAITPISDFQPTLLYLLYQCIVFDEKSYQCYQKLNMKNLARNSNRKNFYSRNFDKKEFSNKQDDFS